MIKIIKQFIDEYEEAYDTQDTSVDWMVELQVRSSTKEEIILEFLKNILLYNFYMIYLLEEEEYEYAAKLQKIIHNTTEEYTEILTKYCEGFDPVEEAKLLHRVSDIVTKKILFHSNNNKKKK